MYQFALTAALLFVSVHANANENLTGQDQPGYSWESRWSGNNSPTIILDEGYEDRFDLLPLSASLPRERTPWAESYWPSQKGGIAYRWNATTPRGFDYTPPSKARAAQMSLDELAQLSPAEKYDLFLGDYSYPTLSMAWGASSPRAPDWAGICHGWSPASKHHGPAKPVVVTNPDGIQIPFGASDVHALLSFYYAFYADSEVVQLGARCFSRLEGRPNCRDVNAGSFHLVLANRIGLMHEGFLADVVRDKEVWNHALYEYRSEVIGSARPSSDAASNTVRMVRVRTTMDVANDDVQSAWEPRVIGTDLWAKKTLNFEYYLELDGQGRIIGGEWIGWDRPDFLWDQKKAEFTGHFEGINRVYQPYFE